MLEGKRRLHVELNQRLACKVGTTVGPFRQLPGNAASDALQAG